MNQIYYLVNHKSFCNFLACAIISGILSVSVTISCGYFSSSLNILIFNIQLAIIYDAVHTVVIPSIKTPYDIFEECIINRRAYYHSKGGIKGLRYYALIGDNDINLKNSIGKTKSMMIKCTNLKPTKNMIKNVYLSRNSSTTNKEKFMIYMFRLNPKFINKYMKYKNFIPK